MKVTNMTSPRTGKPVANQYLIRGAVLQLPDDTYKGTMFQSYDSNVILVAHECNNTGNIHKVFIDKTYWDYSTTTGKYRNQFLGETKKETQAKIASGEYVLTDLN